MSLLSNELLKTITNAAPQEEPTTRLATVTGYSLGKTYVKFFGETDPSPKLYNKTASVGSLNIGHTVILTKINNAYIITGRIS